VAAAIQKGLHKIGRRLGQLYASRVFRDNTDLSANPNLWGKVTEAMQQSRHLIVVLSHGAAESDWVNKEVAHWLAMWPDILCSKLTANMSEQHWRDWVFRDIDYLPGCPALRVTPDADG
jgi:hypothetical protein